MATPELLRAVARRAVAFVQQGHQLLVVVSAMGKTTDGLISLAGTMGKAERREMIDVRRMADLIIDTSDHTVHTLRHLIVQKFSGNPDGQPLKVEIISFGHKYGNPRGLDLLFDVRHLPNPYFHRDLKALTGGDRPVVEFLEREKEVSETIDRVIDLLMYLLPLYQREGKSYLTVGIGCTGGRHRSVMVANAIGRALKKAKFNVTVSHRDAEK